MSRIVIIDDDLALCRSLQIQLDEQGHTVTFAGRGKEGVELAKTSAPDLVLLDLALPDGSGLGFLKQLVDSTEIPVAMITGQQDMKATIEAMRAGAFDYLRKPFELEEVLLLLEKLNRLGRTAWKTGTETDAEPAIERRHEIIGADRNMVQLIKDIGLLSRSRVTVLIEGESGTGKELVARALHEATAPGEPFVAINCSAVVPTLLESELFGHEKGAFTGADRAKTGKLALAGQGTFFLDEIGDMTLELQAKLLRVIQEREFERVGGLQPIPFHARVIAATHRDLKEAVADGTFREDLLYRLAVARLRVPPLRERRGDIRLLVQHLLARIARELDRQVSSVDQAALQKLEAHDWPGNVRELENVLMHAVALSRHDVLIADDLEFSFADTERPAPATGAIIPLKDAEKKHVERALLAHDWNITQAAKALEISPTTLRKKIGDYAIKP